MKENFKRFGHPDGNQNVVVGLAMQRSLVSTESGRHGVLFGWFAILTLISPCCIVAWRTHSLFRPIGGISLRDLYYLFLTDKQTISLNLGNLIKVISNCQEVAIVVQKSGILNSRSSDHFQNRLKVTECCRIAEILIHAHIQGQHLPSPFEKIKEDLLVVYVKLAICLLKLLSQTKQLYFCM